MTNFEKRWEEKCVIMRANLKAKQEASNKLIIQEEDEIFASLDMLSDLIDKVCKEV